MMLEIYGSKKPKGKILREYRKKFYNLRVTIQIGKKGLDSSIKEIEKQLEKNKVVKIRILKNAIKNSRKEGIYEIAKKLLERGIYIIDIRGYTLLLSKEL